MSKSTINANAFDINFDTLPVVEAVKLPVPFAQFFNPIYHDFCGIGLSEEQADAVGFRPTENWKKEKVKFSKESKQCWISNNPRLTILRMSPAYMTLKDTYSLMPYDYSKYDRAIHSRIQYAVIVFLDETNAPIMDRPVRIKVSGGTYNEKGLSNGAIRFCQVFQDWKKELSKTWDLLISKGVIKKVNHVAPQLRTYLFSLSCKFTPTLNKHDTQVHTILPNDWERITADNAASFFVPSSYHELLVKWIEETEEWVSLKKVNEEYTSVEEEIIFDRQETILEINSKFQSLGMNSQEISDFISSRFDESTVTELDDNGLISLNSYLDLEAVNSQSVPF